MFLKRMLWRILNINHSIVNETDNLKPEEIISEKNEIPNKIDVYETCSSDFIDDSKVKLFEHFLASGKIISFIDSNNEINKMNSTEYYPKAPVNMECFDFKPNFRNGKVPNFEDFELEVIQLSKVDALRDDSFLTGVYSEIKPNSNMSGVNNMIKNSQGREMAEEKQFSNKNVGANDKLQDQNHDAKNNKKSFSENEVKITIIDPSKSSVDNVSSTLLSDSHLTLTGIHHFVFENSESYLGALNNKWDKNDQKKKRKSVSTFISTNGDQKCSVPANNSKLRIEIFESFKEIMEKLKRDISVIINYNDLREDIDSTTNIFTKFNILDSVIKQIYFIRQSLCNGGTYFYKSLIIKRREVTDLLKCLREDIFDVYSKLEPEEKYVVARQGGPMSCIFTLFGVLERQVKKAFSEIRKLISMKHTSKLKKRNHKNTRKCSVTSMPLLRHSPHVTAKENKTSICPTKYEFNKVGSLQEIKQSEYKDILGDDNTSIDVFDKSISLNQISKVKNKTNYLKTIKKLINCSDEGFKVCFMQDYLQITVPKKNVTQNERKPRSVVSETPRNVKNITCTFSSSKELFSTISLSSLSYLSDNYSSAKSCENTNSHDSILLIDPKSSKSNTSICLINVSDKNTIRLDRPTSDSINQSKQSCAKLENSCYNMCVNAFTEIIGQNNSSDIGEFDPSSPEISNIDLYVIFD